jgi:hypothetical protein
MYEYCYFSPLNGITIANVLILIFSSFNDNSVFHGIIIFIIIIIIYKYLYFTVAT